MKNKRHDVNKAPANGSVPSRVAIIVSHIHVTLMLSLCKVVSQATVLAPKLGGYDPSL